jgi:hypothetical protein
VIPAGVRFQVQYPTPLASISSWVTHEDQDRLEPSYERALFADLARLLTSLPHDALAVQWDVAVEFAILEGGFEDVDWLSFTVPQYQREPAFFEPLADLDVQAATELYFALVAYHPAEQEPGTTADQVRHIDASLPQDDGAARAWGICTECGMARAERAEVPDLLDQHARILAEHPASLG